MSIETTTEASAGPELSRWQRTLLPGEMVGRDGGGRTVRDWAVDAMAFLFALVVGLLTLRSTLDRHSTVGLVIDVALGLLSLAALWDRRRHPTAIAAAVIAAAAVSALAGGAALVVLFNAAIRCRRRTLAWLVLASVLTSAVYTFLYSGSGAYLGDTLLGLLLIGFTVGWGLFARARRDLVASLHERAARLEAEGQLHAEQAREAERRRIAREMHDVLAHRISLLSLHAGALEFRPDAPPEEVAAAAAVIRESAHAALEELREVIGVLREGTEGATQPPQPSLRDLPELIGEARAAGMRIEAAIELPLAGPEAERISELTGRTAYRIVQEGLTNARKHAPNALVAVRVDLDREDRLVVELRNPQPVAVAAGPGGAPPLPGAGSGLIGLGERVGLAGGELEHGSGAGGEYRLRATLPVER